jgi:hypothetical protein
MTSKDNNGEEHTVILDAPARPNVTDPLYSALGTRMCDAAMARERLHLLYLQFVAEESASRLPRFLITDLPTEGYAGASTRLCRFIATWRNEAVEACDILAENSNKNEHSSHHTNADCENEFISQVLTGESRQILIHSKPCSFMKKFNGSDLNSPFLSRGAMSSGHKALVDDMRHRFKTLQTAESPTIK